MYIYGGTFQNESTENYAYSPADTTLKSLAVNVNNNYADTGNLVIYDSYTPKFYGGNEDPAYGDDSKYGETTFCAEGYTTSLENDGYYYVVAMEKEETPTGLTTVNVVRTVDETISSLGMIGGLNEATTYEYRESKDSDWTTVAEKSTTINDLTAGSYQVRVAASTKSYASDAITLAIGTDNEATYVLTVSEPTFEDEVTGYTPASQALTLTNGGNSAVYVASVAVNSQNFTVNGGAGTRRCPRRPRSGKCLREGSERRQDHRT